MNRETFLQRVRQAAAAGRSYRVHPEAGAAAEASYRATGAAAAARLVDEVQTAGGFCCLADGMEEARQAVRRVIEQSGCASALCWRHPVLQRLNLDELLGSMGVERIDYQTLNGQQVGEARARWFKADIGISSVDYAIAETGTLALASMRGQERSVSLVPPVHLAVVEVEQILPDLFDLFDRLQAGPHAAATLASNWTLITGPSKTGDLELTLTTGVHGPGRLHVVVVGS